MEKINYNVMIDEISSVKQLINDSEVALNLTLSHVNEDFTNAVSRMAPKMSVQLEKAINSGRPEAAILGGAILGTAYVGTLALDGIKNLLNAEAYNKASEELTKYYQRLVSLHGRLIARLAECNKELKNAASHSTQRLKAIEAEIQHLKKLLNEMEAMIIKLKVE